MTVESLPPPPSWHAMNADTAPWAERLQFEFFRRATPARKLHMMSEINRTVRTLACAGLRERYPQAAPAEIERRLAGLLLGPELALKVYGPVPCAPTEGEPEPHG